MPKVKAAPTAPDEVTRYTIKMSNGHQHALAVLAKTYQISQREILEALLDHIDAQKMQPIFSGIRRSKVAEREQKRELIKKLAKLDAAELRELEQLAERGKQRALQ